MSSPWKDMYPVVTGTPDPWKDTYSSTTEGKELDLRDELYNTLFGALDEVPKGRVGMIRRIRRDSNDVPVRCPCRDGLTDESDKDFYCKHCLGIGYYWDERKITYYKNDDALRRWGFSVFYVQYDVLPTDIDFVIEVKRDVEGNPIAPLVRERIWRIDEAEDFRADNGRIEYWRIRATYIPPWSLWYGVDRRTPGAHDVPGE